MNTTTAHAILGVRLLALLFGALGMWLLTANLLESFSEFNPSYLGYFILSQVARPLVSVVIGLALWALSKPIGKLVVRGLS